MKTSVNSIVGKLGKTAALFGVLAIIIASCTQMESPFSVQEPDVKSFEDLNINVKYAESYDQTTITYSRHWPNSISTGLAKTVSDGEGEIMVDYERVHEIVAFDEDGYMSTSIEFLEGDSEMNMPESAYESLKNIMPNPGIEYNPLIKIEASEGVEKGYGKSGSILYEIEYNPEEFRVDLALLDSLSLLSGDSDIENSIDINEKRLIGNGISFELVGSFYAKYELEASQKQRMAGIGSFQEVMDLRSGEIIASSIQNLEGKYLEIVESRYQSVNSQSVLSREVRYSFGEINGEWGITTRTVMQRNNINVIRN